MSRSNQWKAEIKTSYPRFSAILLLLILSAVFTRYDSNRIVYSLAILTAGFMATYYYSSARKTEYSVEMGMIGFFIIVWLGVTSFSSSNELTGYSSYLIPLQFIEFFSIFPLLVLWVIPANNEQFFGIQVMDEETQIKWLWKSSIVILFIINVFDLWAGLEFLILIPMIVEPSMLHKISKNNLPELTLFIQKELSSKFSVPISIIRSITIILFAFMFNYLTSRLWVLVLLGFMFGLVIWFITSITQNFETDKSDNIEYSEIEQYVKKFQKKNIPTLNSPKSDKKKPKISGNTKIIHGKSPIISEARSNTSSKKSNNQEITTESQTSSKAHEMGTKLRKELQKPRYNLGHILSTLTNEDFRTGYKVDKSGMHFQSLKGEWSPPKNLVLFPIDMEKYDFRRKDEILLLGFNQPKESSSKKPVIFIDGGKNKRTIKISKHQIEIGDYIFNMRTLLVSKSQWKTISSRLVKIDENDDISYTGFKTLDQLQIGLTTISDKWIQIRRQMQEAATNFIAGLIGTTDPVFTNSKLLEESILDEERDDDPQLE